jgi:hypothetical protein
MQRKIKVHRNLQGDVTDVKQAKGKYRPKKVDNSWYWAMVKPRDMLWFNEPDTNDELRQQIGERYNMEQIVIDRVILRTTKDEESKQQILNRYGKNT